MAESGDAESTVTMTRTIDAPREDVFEVWTTAEHLASWWGPAGYSLPVCQLDFRRGGAFRYRMRSPDGADDWLHGVFQEIRAPERLVFTFAWGDASGAREPSTLVTVTFEDVAGKTKLSVRHTGLASVLAARDHEGGWSQCLDRLERHASAAASSRGLLAR